MSNGEDRELSDFQRQKFIHLFRIFYDVNHDGVISLADFNQVVQEIKRFRQWEDNDPRLCRISQASNKVFQRIMSQCDEDKDAKVTLEEWLVYWAKFCKEAKLANGWPPMGLWQQEYAKAMFEFLDTSGNCLVEEDEYISVITQYAIDCEDAKECYERLTTEFDSNGDWHEKELDLRRYLALYFQFLVSDCPDDAGNYLWGKIPKYHV